jgi:hypothetical protein
VAGPSLDSGRGLRWPNYFGRHWAHLPFLLANFWVATWIAVAVVAVELAVIAWIRKRYMDTPLLGAIFQVVLGGFLVFLVGILIGTL